MESIKQDLKYPFLAMTTHIHGVMTMIVTENYGLIDAAFSVCVYITYIKYE